MIRSNLRGLLLVVPMLLVTVDHERTAGPPGEAELFPVRISAPQWKTMIEVLRDHEWADDINNLLDIVEAMPAEKYGFRPVPQLRTFGEVVGHITNVQLGFCTVLNGTAPDSTDWEKRGSKDQAISGLRASIRVCDEVLDHLTDQKLLEPSGRSIKGDLVVTVLGHTKRETGKLVTYLRLAGIVPPEIHYQQGRKWRS